MKITDLNKLSHDLIGICEECGLDIVTSDIRLQRNIYDEYYLVADYKDIKEKWIIAPIEFGYKSGKCWITEVYEKIAPHCYGEERKFYDAERGFINEVYCTIEAPPRVNLDGIQRDGIAIKESILSLLDEGQVQYTDDDIGLYMGDEQVGVLRLSNYKPYGFNEEDKYIIHFKYKRLYCKILLYFKI